MKQLLTITMAVFLGGFLLQSCASTEPVAPVEQAYEAAQYETETRDYPDVPAGRFDDGKMWTFEYPPLDYFMEEYGLDATEEWLEKARMATVRLPNCSGSFVSSTGLVLTNHHCAREQITQVSEGDEELLDNGFYAPTLSDERVVEGFYVDQLLAIRDVTDEVYAALEGVESASRRAQIISQVTQQIEFRLIEEFETEGVEILPDVVALYNGGLYSAYVFRRYTDVRLVMAPELEIGYYGGDPDNFTYPRYNLDMTFFRVYENDEPFEPEFYFDWSLEGASEGDPVFVVGNPGSTSRLFTVDQLEYERDIQLPSTLDLFHETEAIFSSFVESHPDDAAELDLRNLAFAIGNAIKAYTGGLQTLQDPYIMGRRLNGENSFRAALAEDTELYAEFGSVHDEIADLVAERYEWEFEAKAFAGVRPGSILSSGTLQRSMMIGQYAAAMEYGEEQFAQRSLGVIPQTVDFHPVLEREMLISRLDAIYYYLGDDEDLGLSAFFGDHSAEELADRILGESQLASVENAADLVAQIMEDGVLPEDDPAVQLGLLLGERYMSFFSASQIYTQEEEDLNRKLGRARYEVYGTTVPPDATFSLRLADGRMLGYDYNGTIAPAFTTFYGLYDRHYSHNQEFPWSLPERWKNPPAEMNLGTPLNLVSTNDIIGGNSGSPLLSINLKLVGLIFDGNIESLAGDYIYTDEAARAVSVDARGMLESLIYIYEADRIVEELRAGR